jgi:hypothetical protein
VSRQAPPVDLICSGGGGWRAAQVLLHALAAAVLAAWLVLQAAWPAGAAAAATGVAALSGGVLGWRLGRPRSARLAWDGQVWRADGTPGEVDVMIDLGRWRLLRFRPAAGGAAWLPVPDAEAGPARNVLLAVLHARAVLPAAAGASQRQNG